MSFGDDGVIIADSNESPALITNEDDDSEVDVALICAIDTFNSFINGTGDPNIAFMMGKLKVKGNMSLAMKLNAMLED